jgi:hypothetical protein
MENKIIKIKNTNLINGGDWKKIEIIADENGRDISYSFFTKKKDGNPTKAFEYFQAHKQIWDNALMNDEGINVEIGYEEREYLGKKDGKMHTGRTILAFRDEPKVGAPIGDQNQAEYRIPDITPEGIPIIEPNEKPRNNKKIQD